MDHSSPPRSGLSATGPSIAIRLAGLAMAAVLPLSLLFAHATLSRLNDEREQAQERALAMARLISNQVDDQLGNAEAMLLVLSRMVSLDPADADRNESLFQATRQLLPQFYQNIKLNAPDGSSLGSSSGQRINVADRKYFRDAMSNGRLGIGEPVQSRSTGQMTLSLALAVPDERGRAAGVVSASLHLDRLQALLDPGGLPPGSVIALLDERGVVLARNIDPEQWVGRDLSPLPQVRRALDLGRGGEELVAADGVPRLSGFYTCRRAPWLVYAGIPSEVALAQVHLQLRQGLLWGGLTLALVVTLVWYLTRGIATPLRRLAADAALLGAGRLQHRTTVRGGGEPGLLAAAFNRMADEVETRARQLAESQEHLAVILDSIGDAVIVTDARGMVTFLNPVARELTGWPGGEALGRPLAEVFRIVDPTSGRPAEDPVARILREGRVVGLANYTALLDRRGEQRTIEDSGAPVRDRHGRIIGVVLVFHDVSERHRAEREALRQKELLQTVFDHIPVMIAVFAPDGRLQMVNQKWSQVLGWSGEEARAVDILTEFYPDLDYRDWVLRFIREASGRWADFRTRVRDGRDGHTLLKNADTALHQVKSHGRGELRFYTQAMNARLLERMTLENDLRHALAREELQIHYQPQVALAGGELVGVEALLRWPHAQRGMVGPAEFIPIAEETGLILELGPWVLIRACAQVRDWQAAGLPPVRVGVNLSAREFNRAGLPEQVAGILETIGLDPGLLELEITETLLT